MAGRHLIRAPAAADFAVDYRQARAFCDGMAHRAAGTELTHPITDNPFTAGIEDENLAAWDAGWTHAEAAAPGAVDGLSCAVYGAIAQEPPP